MGAFRRRLRAIAYLASLIVVGAATWLPTSVFSQTFPGSPFGGGGSGSGVTPPFTDTNSLIKGGTDASKLMRFEVDGFTASTTRVLTPPNADITIAGQNFANTFSGTQIFSGLVQLGTSGNAQGAFQTNLSQTPDSSMLYTGSTNNAWIISEQADSAVDWTVPQQVNPSLFIVPPATSTTQRMGMGYYGFQGRAIKALTAGAATSVVRIPVAAGAATGGTLTYVVFAADAVDQQARSSFIRFAVSNKAATEICGMTNNAGAADASITETEDGNAVSISSGTMTYAITCDVTPANAVDIQINAVSSLTETTFDVYYRIDLLGATEPLPQ